MAIGLRTVSNGPSRKLFTIFAFS